MPVVIVKGARGVGGRLLHQQRERRTPVSLAAFRRDGEVPELHRRARGQAGDLRRALGRRRREHPGLPGLSSASKVHSVASKGRFTASNGESSAALFELKKSGDESTFVRDESSASDVQSAAARGRFTFALFRSKKSRYRFIAGDGEVTAVLGRIIASGDELEESSGRWNESRDEFVASLSRITSVRDQSFASSYRIIVALFRPVANRGRSSARTRPTQRRRPAKRRKQGRTHDERRRTGRERRRSLVRSPSHLSGDLSLLSLLWTGQNAGPRTEDAHVVGAVSARDPQDRFDRKLGHGNEGQSSARPKVNRAASARRAVGMRWSSRSTRAMSARIGEGG